MKVERDVLDQLNKEHSSTVQADKQSWERIASIPGCLATGSCDIGSATVDGTPVYTTWGKNLNAEEQQWFLENTKYLPIHFGAYGGEAELVIPTAVAEALLMAAKSWKKVVELETNYVVWEEDYLDAAREQLRQSKGGN
jgi:hypothetical protein